MKKVFVLAFVAIGLAAASMAQDQSNSLLYGTWIGGPENEKLEFKSPNIWDFAEEGGGRYSYDGTTLTITFVGSNGSAHASISGNSLTIGQFTNNSIGRYLERVLVGTFIKAEPQSGQSWPSAAQLAEYGISGFNLPNGATSPGYRLQPDMYSYPVIVIWFNATSNVNTTARNFFNGWNVRFDDSAGGRIDIGYERNGVRVNYVYDGREVMITAGIDR